MDPQGHLCVHPKGDHRKIRITDIVKEVEASGLKPPLTIRVQDLLRNRVTQINEAFRKAIHGKATTPATGASSRSRSTSSAKSSKRSSTPAKNMISASKPARSPS